MPFPHFTLDPRPGGGISAEDLARVFAEVNRLVNVTAEPPIFADQSQTGIHLTFQQPAPIITNLTLAADANPLKIKGADIVRLDATGFNIRSIDSTFTRRWVLRIWNVGSGSFTIKNQDGAAPTHESIITSTGADIVVTTGGCVLLDWLEDELMAVGAWRAAAICS